MNISIIHVISFVALYSIGEILARLFIFKILNNQLGSKQPKERKMAQFKGHLERFMLSMGLIGGVQQVLIVFGALKIGTWFRPQQEGLEKLDHEQKGLGNVDHKQKGSEKVDHDFFLIGNFLTVIVSLFYYLLYPYFFNFFQSYLDCVR